MDFRQSPLMYEVDEIITSPTNAARYYSATFHVGQVDYEAIKVVAIDRNHDYLQARAPELVLSAIVGAGTFAARLYPARDVLDVTISELPIDEVSNQYNPNAANKSKRYTAILHDIGSPLSEGNFGVEFSEETLNNNDIIELKFDLIGKTEEQLKFLSVGGIYRSNTTQEVVKTILTRYSMLVDVPTTETVLGVDMVPSPDLTPVQQIIIPDAQTIMSVPTYIQEHCNGIYGAGLGCFYQDRHWYVYPCFDITRFNQSAKTLTIINVPKMIFPSIERTYRINGKSVIILSTSELKIRDNTNLMQLNEGNGVRFSDAGKFMNRFATIKGNTATAVRAQVNSEFVSTQRQNGLNFVKRSANPVTSNPMVEYSKLAQRQGMIVGATWENADISLLYPGMPVRMVYMNQEQVRSIDGILLKHQSFTHLATQGILADRHITDVALSIFVKPTMDRDTSLS